MHKSFLMFFALIFSVLGSSAATAADNYKIGAIYPLTGHLAWLGEYYEKAAQLQVDMINEAGGVNGQQLELKIYDSKSSPESTARAAQRLISQDKVVAIIGTASVPMSGALAAVVQESNVPAILNSGYLVSPEKDSYVFNSAHKTQYAVNKPFEYFSKNGMNKIALLMPLGPLGDLGIAAAEAAADQYGIELVGTQRFNPQSPDLTAQLARLRSFEPDAMFSFVTGEPAAMVARNMQQIRFDVPLLVSHGNATPGFLKMIGTTSTELIIPSGKLSMPTSISEDEPEFQVIKLFNEAHNARYGENANYFSGLAADSILLVAEGLKNANAASEYSLRDGIENIKNMPGYGGVFTMSPEDHHGTSVDDMILLSPSPTGWKLIQ